MLPDFKQAIIYNWLFFILATSTMQRFLRLLLKLFLLGCVLAVITVGVVYFTLAPKLPEADSLQEIRLQTPLRIYSAEGKLMAEFGEKRRLPVAFEDIPTPLIEAFLAAEDDRYFDHPGVDYQGLIRAAISLALTGEKTQGGSTITMQVARNFFLSNEKTYLRKLNEIILALEIERVLDKEEILTLYLNKIYLGSRAYGVGAASQVYYGKELEALTLAEMAMIAGLPKAPSAANPINSPERALERRDYVLRRMLEVGFIDEDEFLFAIEAPVTAEYHGREIEAYAPYAAEMVRTQLQDEYGDELYTRGLNVYTTIRADHQKAAMNALQKALIDYDQRHGFRGPLAELVVDENATDDFLDEMLEEFSTVGELTPAIVTRVADGKATIYIKKNGAGELTLEDMSWARPYLNTNAMGANPDSVDDVLANGDVVYVKNADDNWQLSQMPEAQGALVSVSPHDGGITALQGGFDYFHSRYNRVTQSRRQPGSGFKPFIYSAALEKGYTTASIINDAPVVFDDPGLESAWRPENYSGRFFGPTRLREALVNSRNLVSIRLLRDIGADYAIDYAKRFGFKSDQLHENLSLALGSGNAPPMTMASAYAVLANGGYAIEPYLISRVESGEGELLSHHLPPTVCEACVEPAPAEETALIEEPAVFNPAKRAISAQNAFIMNSLLKDVVKRGTGRKALSLGRNDLAGKTGTTNSQLDAWFNGFNANLVATAWVGFDTPRTLGRYETGGRAALPMWIDFMEVALDGMPEESMSQPVDMVTVRIDPETGLLARPEAEDAIYEIFREGTAPERMAPSPGDADSGGGDSIRELF